DAWTNLQLMGRFILGLLRMHFSCFSCWSSPKDELLLLTIGIGAACSLYFILVFSLE
ncbi:hypothetical protein ACJX0J_029487, partial [Zea mays]